MHFSMFNFFVLFLSRKLSLNETRKVIKRFISSLEKKGVCFVSCTYLFHEKCLRNVQ